MSTLHTSSRPIGTSLKCMFVAVGLAVSGVAVSAGMSQQVSTRADPNLEQHNGRDSVYALSPVPVYLPAQAEPQRYGRAGGFVGSDRFEMSRSPAHTDSSAHGVRP